MTDQPTAQDLPAGATAAADDELAALPAPPRRERNTAALLMAVTALASAWMVWALRGEVRYALRGSAPLEAGELATVVPDSSMAETFVRGTAMLATVGAVRYERPLEHDTFRAAQVAGNAKLWVEVRVSPGEEGPRYVPPTAFVGRLVPLAEAGLRHGGLGKTVLETTGVRPPPDAWLLVDGALPEASRWAIALAALCAGFAAWNLASLVRALRPARD